MVTPHAHNIGSRKSTNRLIENNSLVHLAREAIDQEATLTLSPSVFGLTLVLFQCCMHGVLQKFDRHLARYDLAITDVLFDQIAVLRSLTVLLMTQEVSSCGVFGA